MESLAGQILIASGRLADPNFVHSVILMVQHDEHNALGLVLNRPTDTTLAEACEQASDLPCDADGVLYEGGPCEGPLMVVHARESAGQLEIVPGVFFTAERDHIESLLRENEKPAKYFVGYSGWGPGQLESEMETGSWLASPASKEIIFEEDEERWSKLMLELTLGKWIKPSQLPADPSQN